MFSLFSLIVAILSLSFLIFIHELGHYFMAKKVGMRVEVFSIGFGTPIFSWVRDGVKWQIGWLPFGGYVKIAGTETDSKQDPYTIKDGFFGKSPWDRIKVAFMGPAVNLIFALMAFALLWIGGGREKNFSEYTSKIGYVDPKSELYARGIRPGDEITAYNGVPYQGAKDHIYQPLVSRDQTEVAGNRVNYATHDKTSYDVRVKNYSNPLSLDKEIMTAGILAPASNIIYNKLPGNVENPLPTGSPLADSGIQYGDKVVWLDGQQIFSVPQLTSLLNDERVLVTVERGGHILLARVPRVLVQEFRMDPGFKDELIDWQYEADLKNVKFQNLYAFPYDLNNQGVVEGPLKFIEKDKQDDIFPSNPYSYMESPLQVRDRIVAVNGEPVQFSYQILKKIQERKALVIVERTTLPQEKPSYAEADKQFDDQFDAKEIEKITSTIGLGKPVTLAGKYVLLKPVQPIRRSEIALTPEKELLLKEDFEARRRRAEAVADPEKRQATLKLLDAHQKEYIIGLPAIMDQRVEYNPVPTTLFSSVFSEIYRTLKALLTGTLNPKWLSGPVGIVQVVQSQAMLSLNETLFWVGAISLNLGILNLLPIPMLDGGTIVMSLVEMVTGKKLKPKTLEKIILPFAILLILFFVFVTYHDLERLLGGFFK